MTEDLEKINDSHIYPLSGLQILPDQNERRTQAETERDNEYKSRQLKLSEQNLWLTGILASFTLATAIAGWYQWGAAKRSADEAKRSADAAFRTLDEMQHGSGATDTHTLAQEATTQANQTANLAIAAGAQAADMENLARSAVAQAADTKRLAAQAEQTNKIANSGPFDI